MDKKFKKIGYLKCSPKYRVKCESLVKVIQLTKKSGLLSEQDKPKIILEGDELSEVLSQNVGIN